MQRFSKNVKSNHRKQKKFDQKQYKTILLMKYIINKYYSPTLDFEWPRQSRQYLIFFKLDFFKTFDYVFLPFSLGPSTICKTPTPRPQCFFLTKYLCSFHVSNNFPQNKMETYYILYFIHLRKNFITLKTFNVNFLYPH